MRRSHLLALPSPLDDVQTLCGMAISDRSARGDMVVNKPALATCVPCLRAQVALQQARIEDLESLNTNP
jgi:hypothetical protein